MVRRAKAPGPLNKDAIAAVLDACRDNPKELIRVGQGNLERCVELLLIEATAGATPLMSEAIRARFAEVRAGLLGPDPTALDRLLVDRVALCWLEVHLLQISALVADKKTLNLIEHRDRRIERAERRYLAAMKALATVRKMKLPSVQIHVDNRQVHARLDGPKGDFRGA